jgi:serine-type D-Ala-D-Ala carboxypeptidase/endopeptidase (penicillin-binding protein 4)
VTAAAGAEKQITTQRIVGEEIVHVFGRLPVGAKEEFTEVTVPRPASWFARALHAAIIRRGITVGGTARSLRWPDASPIGRTSVRLGEVISPPMHELVTAFMKPSQNLETDLIFAHIGESKRAANTPTWRTSEDLALPVLREFLRQHGLPQEEVRFEEGSGLSRNNLTTANATVALLTLMDTHHASEAFLGALPIAGVDGTLKRRMKGTPAEGNVRAKTGSLRYANSLSGYVTTAAGEPLVFSLMLNRNGNQPAGRNVREELDDIAVLLARFSGKSGPPAEKP